MCLSLLIVDEKQYLYIFTKCTYNINFSLFSTKIIVFVEMKKKLISSSNIFVIKFNFVSVANIYLCMYRIYLRHLVTSTYKIFFFFFFLKYQMCVYLIRYGVKLATGFSLFSFFGPTSLNGTPLLVSHYFIIRSFPPPSRTLSEKVYTIQGV